MKEQELGALLDALEAELRRLDCWEASPPPADALASPLPFAHDRLTFTQWLQWLFLPRLRTLLASGARLPARSGIAPMAEVSLADSGLDAAALVALLRRIDGLLEGDATGQ